MSVPDLSLSGKVAIITGSSQGIGKGLANGFVAAGASVVLVARSVDRLDECAHEIENSGGKAMAVPADVTSSSQVSQMVQKTLEAFGRIDVLVNCAGGSGEHRFIPMLDLNEDIWDEIIRLNLKSAYLCSRAAGRVMTEQRSGSIINFSSGAATQPVANMTHYCAAKAGINQLTRVLAVELGPYNVRVNAISPGLTATPSEEKFMPPYLMGKYAKMIPLGRIGQPEDILGAALFLASGASEYITGTIIPVSGGPQ
jgi:NAD(P)-dependent dehydrogenase (short-subunit alcohol dehydrogenase family)